MPASIHICLKCPRSYECSDVNNCHVDQGEGEPGEFTNRALHDVTDGIENTDDGWNEDDYEEEDGSAGMAFPYEDDSDENDEYNDKEIRRFSLKEQVQSICASLRDKNGIYGSVSGADKDCMNHSNEECRSTKGKQNRNRHHTSDEFESTEDEQRDNLRYSNDKCESIRYKERHSSSCPLQLNNIISQDDEQRNSLTYSKEIIKGNYREVGCESIKYQKRDSLQYSNEEYWSTKGRLRDDLSSLYSTCDSIKGRHRDGLNSLYDECESTKERVKEDLSTSSEECESTKCKHVGDLSSSYDQCEFTKDKLMDDLSSSYDECKSTQDRRRNISGNSSIDHLCPVQTENILQDKCANLFRTRLEETNEENSNEAWVSMLNTLSGLRSSELRIEEERNLKYLVSRFLGNEKNSPKYQRIREDAKSMCDSSTQTDGVSFHLENGRPRTSRLCYKRTVTKITTQRVGKKYVKIIDKQFFL